MIGEITWEVWRDGEKVTVTEKDLTQGERDTLRVKELLEELDSKEIVTDDLEFEERMKLRVSEWILGGDPVSPMELARLEAEYVLTLPYAELTPEQEVQLKELMAMSASDALDGGFTYEREDADGKMVTERIHFKTIGEAREFFGLGAGKESE